MAKMTPQEIINTPYNQQLLDPTTIKQIFKWMIQNDIVTIEWDGTTPAGPPAAVFHAIWDKMHQAPDMT